MKRFVIFFLCFASPALAQKKTALKTVASSKAVSTRDAASCPDQSGLLDSISVPINQPLQLEVFIFQPSNVDEAFDVSVDNPAIANAGDPTQGFLGEVSIPAGSQTSNPFTVLGSTIGQANLIIQSVSGDYGTSETPIGPWDVNPGNDSFPVVDANPPDNSCLVAGSANFSTDPNVLANCGSPVHGAASDGVTQLLLRSAGGIPGTMCYAITSTSSLDQGSIQTGVLSTQPGPNNYQYGFTYYTAPQYYGDTSDSRTVNVLFTFTPSQGNGNTTTIPGSLTVVRPPIMLLHGLWANAGSWNSNYSRNDAFHTTYAGDYSATNGSSFSVNEPYVDTAVQTALNQFRQKQYAATQADVIAHSMGGILTRLYAGSNSFQQPGNYNQGDIRRLITLDTPHFGSSFANLLVELYQANPSQTVSTVSGLTGGSVTQGAVCDLAENSPALAALSGGTTLPSQVITATGGPAGTPSSPAPYWGGATFLGIKSFESALTSQYCTNWIATPDGPVCTATAFYFPQATVDAFRFRQQNDAVVGLSSEQGGVAGINFPAYIHFHIPPIPFVQRGITDGSDVATQVFTVLDGPSSGLIAALPGVPSNSSGAPLTVPGLGPAIDSATYAAQCGGGGPLKPASQNLSSQLGRPAPRLRSAQNPPSALINLTSPAAGAVFATGSTINMTVTLSPPLTNQVNVSVTLTNLTNLTAVWTSGLTFTATFNIPAGLTGPLTLTPNYTDTSGNTVSGASVVVGITPQTAPQSIALQQSSFVLPPGAANQQLIVSGTYADGSTLDLTSVLTGTSYLTSNVNVATVTGDGVLQVTGAGVAVITVKNGGLTTFATVLVQNPASPLGPQLVSSQFSAQQSGFRLNRTSGFFTQTVTLTNTSGVPVIGPVNYVLTGLPSGVTLRGATGTTQKFSPGSPYVAVPLSGDAATFAPGGSVTLTLQFLDPGRASISYTGNVIAVTQAP